MLRTGSAASLFWRGMSPGRLARSGQRMLDRPPIGGGSCDAIMAAMSWLQFIDSMTGRLAWPVAALTLGLIFRRSLVQLFARVRTLRWGETEAELAEADEAAKDLQSAAKQATEPLPDDESENEQERRRRLERVIRSAFEYGASTSKIAPSVDSSDLVVEWGEDGNPTVKYVMMQHQGHGTGAWRKYLEVLGSNPTPTLSNDQWEQVLKALRKPPRE